MAGQSIRFFFALTSLVLTGHCLFAENAQQQSNQYPQQTNEDIWFGPGFYYGTWFDNEDDYQGWRNDHRDYPSNRDYYNHDHPVPYSHDDGRVDDRNRDDGDRGGDRDGNRDGGDRGGGDRGGGGRR